MRRNEIDDRRQQDLAVKEAVEKGQNARLLMGQSGVGPVTSRAFVLTMGDVSGFPRGKQGNRFIRMLLVEAGK